MKIYFAPCGIGLGHAGRCVPIAKKLVEKDNKIIFSTYLEGTSYVAQEKLPVIRAPPIDFQVKSDGTVDFKQTAINPGPFLATFTFLKQIKTEIKAMTHFDPDVVVSDTRISPILAARMLGIPRICMLNQFQVMIPRKKRFLRLSKIADAATLTIIGKAWTSKNTVLIPDFPTPYTISANNLKIPKAYRKNIRLIGPILPLRPNELPTKKQLRKQLKLPEEKPVIFVPISGSSKEKVFLTEILKTIFLGFPKDYTVVISLGSPNSNDTPQKNQNITIYDWIPNRFEYLKTCDLVISRAGHGTVTQCLSYGKPMILIPTPNHTEQISNAKQAENLGVAKIILQEKLNKERLLKTIQHTLENDTLKKCREVQENVFEHDGLKNAVEIIEGTTSK